MTAESIPDPERKRVDGVSNRTEVRKFYEDTVRQIRESGRDPAAEPAVQRAKANLDTADQELRKAADAHNRALTIERKVRAIREAGAGDLSVPAYAHSLMEDALRAGATTDRVRAATGENPYWPSETG
jgi:hypothetical protein